MTLTHESSKASVMRWWVDAAYGVHPYMKIRYDVMVSLGKGGM